MFRPAGSHQLRIGVIGNKKIVDDLLCGLRRITLSRVMIKRRIHEAFPSPLCFGQFRREASQHSSSGTDILDCFDASLRNIAPGGFDRSEEHTSELQSLMRLSYAVFCLQKKKKQTTNNI